MKIGVLGATGPAGSGFAARLASLGYDVVTGSRDLARAEAAVAKLRGQWGDRVGSLRSGGNADAVEADLVVVAVPWDAAVSTAAQYAVDLAGKIVVSMANGLTKQDREFRPEFPEEGSIAAAMQAAIPDARVVAALQHIPAAALADLDHPIDSDVIVCADDDGARAAVIDLVSEIPDLRGFDGGSLTNAVGVEALGAVLLTINLRHRGHASLRLMGVEPRRRDSS